MPFYAEFWYCRHGVDKIVKIYANFFPVEIYWQRSGLNEGEILQTIDHWGFLCLSSESKDSKLERLVRHFQDLNIHFFRGLVFVRVISLYFELKTASALCNLKSSALTIRSQHLPLIVSLVCGKNILFYKTPNKSINKLTIKIIDLP